MPLVPETKMADVGKLISLGNLLVWKVTWFVLTTTSATLILSRDFGADCMTRIASIFSRLSRTHSFHFDSQRHFLLHCNLQRQLTSFHFDLQRQLTLLILTYRVNTLSYIFHLQSQHTLSYFRLQSQHTFSISTHRDNTLFYTATYRDNTLSLLHLTSSSQPHENVYSLQLFSSLFYLFG